MKFRLKKCFVYSMVSHHEPLIKHQITRGHNMAHEWIVPSPNSLFVVSLLLLSSSPQIVCIRFIFAFLSKCHLKTSNNAWAREGNNVAPFEAFNNTTIFQNIKCLIIIISYTILYNWFPTHLLFKQLDEIFYELNINMTISEIYSLFVLWFVIFF